MTKVLGWFLVFLGSLLIGMLIRQEQENRTKWQEFSTKHHCVVTYQEPPSLIFVTIFAAGLNGTMTPYQRPVTVPGKTEYTCNDGKKYRR